MEYEYNEPTMRNIEVEYDFIYKGLKCYVTLTCFGWRGAYFVLNKNNRYYGRQLQSLNFIDCHGGVNYAASSHPCIMSDDEWIIGWDYNHQGDAYDFEAVDRLFGEGTAASVKGSYYLSNANMLFHGSGCRKYSVDDIALELKQVIDRYKLDE